MKPHTTHHDDCGCLSEKHRAEIDALRARVAEVEAEQVETRRHNAELGLLASDKVLEAIQAQAEVRELREKLRPHVCEVDEMSWHGEAMHCALCGATWNNGEKRNEPATPETHKPECLLSRPPGDDTALREVLKSAMRMVAEGIDDQLRTKGGAVMDFDALVNRILGQPGDDAKEGR